MLADKASSAPTSNQLKQAIDAITMNNEQPSKPADESSSRTNSLDQEMRLSLEQIRVALSGLKFGSVNVIVQDGVVIQIDRTEKHRLRNSAKSNT
jgi:hypothetical protein